ncbi:MAG: hypothetical protein JWL69_175 [Phycisphaerales bacterium]|jgi:hypothetical protein|nr:hypothetical protein [Phycisphaerales bacterium]MDB5355984.1 hypothetical protein [Phycisphaerales bacterium]
MRTKSKIDAKHRNPKQADGLPEFKTGEEFDALSPAEKEAVWNYYNRPIPLSETRAPNAKERAIIKEQKAATRRKLGRPQVGRGVKVISLSVERELLKRADALARRRKITRAKLVAEGLSLLLKAS